ncbi:MAG: SPFH domain-containing protein [Patescibacteria group bacterium]|jgi:regulator of protease activity HflC (stomatin/prohibitin superfamily)
MAIFWIILAIFVLIVLVFASAFTVQQQTVAVIQRFGKFKKMSHSGLNLRLPLIDHIAGHISLRINQLDVKIETKTEDNVFVHVTVSVQYQVLPEKLYDAFYKLINPKEQISSYVFDIVRAQVPKLKLDNVFENKDEIANAVNTELSQAMSDFGYQIIKSLVTDIEPDAQVKAAMNEINSAQRLRVAAQEKGEAEKVLMVKKAEAESESKKLQGEGIANQRRAIINGLKESVDDFQKSIKGSTAHDVMNLVMVTQYFDTLKDIGASSKANAVFIPHSPGAVADLTAQIRDALLQADGAKQ